MKQLVLFILNLSIILIFNKSGNSQNWNDAQWKQFHKQAVEESLIPIHPGEPNKSPFWNINAKRFINVPSFDFNEIDKAKKYLFTVISDENYEYYSFEANHPWALLTPVWTDLPVGIVYAKAEGVDFEGNRIGIAGERMFYKAAPFNGPYKKQVIDYKSSATLNLKTLFDQPHYQRWINEKTPSPEYSLYCYPSKTIGSVIQGMVLYSKLSHEDKNDVIIIARNSANYLISIAKPEGSVLEYFPPTYAIQDNGTDVARERIDQIMMFYPAIVGSAYLDLYEATYEKQYLNAAIKIAETYKKIQLPSGSWPLMANFETGVAVSRNLCVPTDIIEFLNRLIKTHGMNKFEETSQKAFNWIVDNPMKTFHWEGQFEDVGYSESYSNMERGKPLAFARLLFERANEYPENIEKAEELIRFAEDQFIVWERPLPRELLRTPERPIPTPAHDPETWMTPCALEQYGYYTPIDASVASAVLAFKMAYEITGKELYLAKAISLANAQTYAQHLSGGIYPTYQRNLEKNAKENKPWRGWINCATITSVALLELDKVCKISEK